jgi:hypothetical protein
LQEALESSLSAASIKSGSQHRSEKNYITTYMYIVLVYELDTEPVQYREDYAKRDRLRNSPIYFMRRLLNSG